jgi:hypothetical protein
MQQLINYVYWPETIIYTSRGRIEASKTVVACAADSTILRVNCVFPCKTVSVLTCVNASEHSCTHTHTCTHTRTHTYTQTHTHKHIHIILQILRLPRPAPSKGRALKQSNTPHSGADIDGAGGGPGPGSRGMCMAVQLIPGGNVVKHLLVCVCVCVRANVCVCCVM